MKKHEEALPMPRQKTDNVKSKSVGSKVVERLARFSKTLESVQRVSELPEVLTVRTVKLNLRPKSMKAPDVKAIRKRLEVSQAVFAEFLGVSPATVRDWEQGNNAPSGPACRIIEEMNREPDAWFNRFREIATGAT